MGNSLGCVGKGKGATRLPPGQCAHCGAPRTEQGQEAGPGVKDVQAAPAAPTDAVATPAAGCDNLGDPQWLSTLLSLMWPHLSVSVEKMVWQILPGVLATAKPAWLTTLSLKTFALGTVPPRIDNVRVVPSNNLAVPGIYLEADLHWVSDALDIELSLNPLPKCLTGLSLVKGATTFTVGVEDISIQARCHISMKPMIDEVPVIGGLQISFLEVPDLFWNLKISGGGDKLLDQFEPWLIAFVEDNVMSQFVYPGHIFSPLKQGIPDMQSAAGVLEVEVLEAQEVPKMDYLSQSSPYCKVWLSGAQKTTWQTEVVDYTKNPVWSKNNRFGLTVHSPEHQDLVLVLFDSDYGNADDEIGRIHFSLSRLDPGQTMDVWLGFDGETYIKRKKKPNPLLAGCRLRIRATYQSMSQADIKRLHAAAEAKQEFELDMIKEPAVKDLVDRYGLLSQLSTVTFAPPPKPAATDASKQPGVTEQAADALQDKEGAGVSQPQEAAA